MSDGWFTVTWYDERGFPRSMSFPTYSEAVEFRNRLSSEGVGTIFIHPGKKS